MNLQSKIKKHLKHFNDLYSELSQESNSLDMFKQFSNLIDPSIKELQEGDTTNIDKLFAYLALDKKFLQSGYKKEKICKYLTRVNLEEEQKRILKEILDKQTNITKREQGYLNKLLEKL